MSNKMIVQMGSFKGKQLIREPLKHKERNGKTAKDHASGAWARRPMNVRDRQDRVNELK